MKRSARDKAVKLLPSGIPFFDGLLGGGYGKDKLIAVAGGAASGKTLFALQTFLARQFTDNSRGLIISSEENSKEMVNLADRYTFKTGKYLQIERVYGGVAEVTALLKQSAKGKKVGHLLINSVTASGAEAKESVLLVRLLDLLAKLRFSAVLVYNTKTNFSGKRFPDDIVFERADGFILLKRSCSGGEESFRVKILKLRAAEFAKSEKDLILKAKGLEVKENGVAGGSSKPQEIFVVSDADDAALENEFSEKFAKEHGGRRLSFVGITGHNSPGGKEYRKLVESCGRRFNMVPQDLFQVKNLAREKQILPFGHLLEDYGVEGPAQEYYREVLEACKYNGRLYALPRFLSGSYLLYRKDLFNKYGLTKPESYDDLAKKVKYVLGKEPGMEDGFVYSSSGDGANFLLLQNAAAENNKPNSQRAIYNPDAYRDILEFLLECRNRYGIVRKGSLSWIEKFRLFEEGKVVSGVFWQYDYFNFMKEANSALKGKVGIMVYPKKNDGTACAALYKGVVFTIPADTPNYSDSMSVIKFLTSVPIESRIRAVSKLVLFSARPGINLQLAKKHKEITELSAGIDKSCYPGDFISNNYIKETIVECLAQVSSGGSIDGIMKLLTKRLAVARRSRTYGSAILEAELFIGANLKGRLALGLLADKAKMSRSSFAKMFCAQTGQTVHEYILEKRVQKAKEFIRGNERLTLGEIAMKTGFYDLNHFSRIFKKVTNASPSKYLLQEE